MTDEDVVRLFHKANRWDVRGLKTFMHDLQQFAVAVQEEERERMAMICHQYRDWSDNPAEAIAKAILNKGE
jgi:hypothetical protein